MLGTTIFKIASIVLGRYQTAFDGMPSRDLRRGEYARNGVGINAGDGCEGRRGEVGVGERRRAVDSEAAYIGSRSYPREGIVGVVKWGSFCDYRVHRRVMDANKLSNGRVSLPQQVADEA